MNGRDFLFLNCQDGKHDWQRIGGANAGCGKDCSCSVPVYECAICGDCDYGDNAEAREIMDECACLADMRPVPRCLTFVTRFRDL
jgi:hypothetical protein